ncbi:hypothetical protein PO909_000051 [Leuciscus waleckii]
MRVAVKRPQLVVESQPAKGSSAVASKGDGVPQKVSDSGVQLGRGVGRDLPQGGDPKLGKARKGLGPSRSRAVGVLPNLTPVERPGLKEVEKPEPMEVEEEIVLEESQAEPVVPQEVVKKKGPEIPETQTRIHYYTETVSIPNTPFPFWRTLTLCGGP